MGKGRLLWQQERVYACKRWLWVFTMGVGVVGFKAGFVGKGAIGEAFGGGGRGCEIMDFRLLG